MGIQDSTPTPCPSPVGSDRADRALLAKSQGYKKTADIIDERQKKWPEGFENDLLLIYSKKKPEGGQLDEDEWNDVALELSGLHPEHFGIRDIQKLLPQVSVYRRFLRCLS